MSVNTIETPGVPDAWVRDDEIDLRQYLDVLIRWWREIVLITLAVVTLAALGLLAMRFLLPPVYVASADVAIARTVSDVSFDERFVTTSDEMGADVTSAGARRSALLGLAVTGGIAQEVIDDLGELLEPNERNPSALLELVEAESGPAVGTRTESDLIRISVTTDSPEKAAAIANTWAQAYVRQVNTVYGQVPNEVFASIELELTNAEQIYQERQAEFEAFLASSPIDELNNRIAVLQEQINREVALVQAYWRDWQKANEYLATAQALRAQVEQGGDGAARSNMMALQMLKLAIYGQIPSSEQPSQVIELRDIPEVTQVAMLEDLDGLSASLEGMKAALEQSIAQGQARLGGGVAEGESVTSAGPLAGLYQEIRTLRAQLEAETAKRIQLEQRRDISREAYKSLSNKVAELNLARAAASSEVRFAAPAVPPAKPEEKISLLIGIGLAGFLGLFLALVLAFLGDYLGYQPFLVRRTA